MATAKKTTNTTAKNAACGNPFDKFMKHDEHKAYIKSLDYEITYRKLTMAEDDAFNIRLLEGVSKENQNLNVKQGSEIKYEKISTMLIDPMVTVDQLKSMDADAGKVIIEILKVIEKDDMIDDEGNLKS